jgi:ubiquinone/menaquinone biosynthesis C-methylase UbiE
MVTLASKVGLTRGCVLDIGSGPGWVPIELALRHPGWQIWAMDASESMVDHAREAAARWGVADRIHFVRGNAEDIPFIKGMFDVVYSNFTLHHLPIPEVMLNEAARVVRGGGRVIIRDLLRQPAWKIPILMTFSKYVLHCNDEQLRMYEESLAAALSVKEVRLVAQRSSLSMADVRTTQGLYVTITT